MSRTREAQLAASLRNDPPKFALAVLLTASLGSTLAMSASACRSDAEVATVAPGGDFRPIAPAQVMPDATPIGAPVSPLPLGSLAVEWSPPMLTTGDYEGLAQTLGRYPAMGLVLGSGVSGMAWEKRIYDLIKSFNPNAEVVIRNSDTLEHILEERGERPVERRSVPDGGRDIFGHPTYVLEDVHLRTSWLERESKLIGADAFVIVASVRETDQREEVYQVGSCGPLMQRLEQIRQQSSAYLTQFEAHANARLAQHYSAVVNANFEALRGELAAFEVQRTRSNFETQRQWDTHECGQAYLTWLDGFRNCTGAGAGTVACEYAPRMVFEPEVGVGQREPREHVPARCTQLLERDYVKSMRSLGSMAATSAAPELDLLWAEMAARRAVVTDIERQLDQQCQPAARRFPSAAIDEAQLRMQDIGRILSEAPPQAANGQWQPAGFATHTSEHGGIYLLLRYAPSERSAAARASATLSSSVEFLDSQARCKSSNRGERVYVLIADVERGSASYYGRFMVEDLFCTE